MIQVLFISFLHFFAWGQTGGRLLPVDQSSEDASFASFRKELLKAIAVRDVTFLKGALSEDVMYSFGADPERKNAIDGFLKHYGLTDKKHTAFWDDLHGAMQLGCTGQDENFTCPYVYSQWPDQYDSFQHIAVVKPKAPIRAKPDASSAEIRSTDFDILKTSMEQVPAEWYALDLGKGAKGYLAKADGRSSISFRANFIKIGKDWKIKYFIEGD